MARYRRKSRTTKKAPTRRRRSSQPSVPTKRLAKRRRIASTPELEKGFRFLRTLNSQRLAAKSAGVPVKRFRQFIRENKLAKFKGRRWRFTDKRRRQVVAITTRGEKEIVVRGFEPASWAMSHRNAVRQFLEMPDVSLLSPFEGVSITDIRGRKHHLEIRPNVLFRRSSAGGEHYEQIYRLVT